MSTVKLGINGFGRIGRLFSRVVILRSLFDIEAINDPALDSYSMAYLLRYDSVHGRFPLEVVADGKDHIRVNGKPIRVFSFTDASQIPWKDCGVSLVAETSGKYTTQHLASAHLKGGAERVVLSAPPKDEETPTFVYGVNHEAYRPEMQIVSNASCTSNCLIPLAKVLNDQYGIEEGLMSTVHAVTASQHVVDGPSKRDYRAGRSAGRNIIPASTGAAKTIGMVLPELKGKITGLAFRVPVENVSVLDLNVKLSKPIGDFEDFFRCLDHIEKDPNHPLHGIIGVTKDAVVSSDINQDTRSCIVDANASIMLNPTFVKIVAYYDNEWGYAYRLADFMHHISCKCGLKEHAEGK